ncbi:PP2C family protein-serine/threonine phosphatase [Plantactinospora sp. WMMB334]|uniref:PP2C family protein-serine/threonine phosphatase n=1 Tax=Plantactinospora sp. WMMB334 TaxID=3404119 RepID=UPI003B92273D
MTSPFRLEAASRTHVGYVRRRNEDCYLQGRHLFAVADGLGGHVAGDVASSAAIDALRAHDRAVGTEDLAETLGRAVSEVNETLRRRIRERPELTGMGTTLVALLWSRTDAALANIGDSRAYLMRNRGSGESTFRQVSEDHTYQHLVAGSGAVPHLSGMLARFLDGRHDGRSPDLSVLPLQPGDRILLCSDGLSSYVPEELIHNTLGSGRNPRSTADQLVTLALDHGGHDNITAIIVDVHNPHLQPYANG